MRGVVVTAAIIAGLTFRSPEIAAAGPTAPAQPGACAVRRVDHPITTRPGRTVSVFSPVGNAVASTGGTCDDAARPPVFFAHGYAGFDPSVYQALIEHLVSRGHVVVFPSYPTSGTFEEFYGIVHDGWVIGAGKEPRIDYANVGFVGHSFGGGMLPYQVAQATARGWGASSVYVVALAPWYSYFAGIGHAPIEVPGHTRWLTVAFEQDSIVDNRIGIETYDAVRLPPGSKRHLTVRTDERHGLVAGHLVPNGAAPTELMRGGVFEPIDSTYRCARLGEGCANDAELADMGDAADGLPLTTAIVASEPLDSNPMLSGFFAWECTNGLNPRSCPAQPYLTNAPAGVLLRELNLPAGGSQMVRFEIGDDATSASDLTVEVLTDTPGLLPADAFVLGADTDGRFLTVTPAAGARGEGSFRVRVGDGANVIERRFPVRVGVPGPPQRPSASPAENAAVVSWRPPVFNGGVGISQYTITASPGGQSVTVSGSARSATVTGLTPGVGYSFTVTARNSAGQVSSPASTGPVVPFSLSRLRAVEPARLVDTRFGVGLGGAFRAGESRRLKVTGTAGVPPAGVTAVVLNVTLTGVTAPTHLTAWPAGEAMPLASNLNATTGQTVANLVTVKVGAGGEIALYNNSGTAHLIADVVGYYDDTVDPGGMLNPITPRRVHDSRSGSPLGPGAVRTLALDGGGVPSVGVEAVVMNVTVTGATAGSHLTVFPAGSPMPPTSNLNFVAGQTVPNLVLVKAGPATAVSFANFAGTVHLIVDVVGWFGSAGEGSPFHPITPVRILDSRSGIGGPVGPFGPAEQRNLDVTGVGGVPTAGVTAIVVNVTVTQPTTASHLTVWPDGETMPPTSNLNFVAGQTVPNLVVVKVGPDGEIAIFNNEGTVEVIADVVGWYG